MTVIGITLHFLNLLAPAASLAALAAALCWVMWRREFRTAGAMTLFSAGLFVNILITVLGLIIQGRDGRMLTYGLMVLGCATTLWWLMFVVGRRPG